jgi:hypothetical protein
VLNERRVAYEGAMRMWEEDRAKWEAKNDEDRTEEDEQNIWKSRIQATKMREKAGKAKEGRAVVEPILEQEISGMDSEQIGLEVVKEEDLIKVKTGEQLGKAAEDREGDESKRTLS